MDRLDGKVALVTGGGTGIGAATARRLVAHGARVCVTGRRRDLLERVVETCGRDSAMLQVGDLAEPEDVQRMVDSTISYGGRLDILVNNAAANPAGSVEDLDVPEWRHALDVNVTGAMLTMRAAVPHMRRAGGGAIVNIASAAGVMATPGLAAYCVSKAALVMLSKQAALDLGAAGIRVNAICPGWVRTEMSEAQMDILASLQRSDRESAFDSVIRHQPLQRVAEPDEVAAVVAFLAASDASYLTAGVINVDGGALVVNAGTTAFSDAVKTSAPL